MHRLTLAAGSEGRTASTSITVRGICGRREDEQVNFDDGTITIAETKVGKAQSYFECGRSPGDLQRTAGTDAGQSGASAFLGIFCDTRVVNNAEYCIAARQQG
jgi:hypothetical protein